MNITNEIRANAKLIDAKIILPEADLDERVMQACEYILANGLAKLVVFGEEKQFKNSIVNNANCEIINIDNCKYFDEFANQLYELRKHKGLTLEESKQLIKNPAYFAMMMLKNNMADGVVAGAKFTTADTLHPALQIIKTKPGKNTVVGSIIMAKEGCNPLIFADVSLIEKPNVETLAEIAVSAAEFMEKVLKEQPKVAMLSYSTKGSANSEMVDAVKQATEIAKQSGYLIDGEMQVDSALDKATAQKKGIISQVGGNANVLVFPDLNAGNIGYKLVARLGGYTAIGPIMLNFNKPVNDLSRGCTAQEIVDTVCITKLQIEQ